MRIAFIYPATEFDKKYHAEGLPIGLLYLTSVAEQRFGATVEIYDGRHGPEAPAAGDGNRFDLVGFTSMSMQIPTALGIARRLRGGGYRGPIAFGGPHASVAPDHLKEQPFADAVFLGESEDSFLAYLNYLEGKPHDLQRVWIRGKSGEWTYHPGDRFIEDLDSLPFPAREKYGDLVRRWKAINMTTTRGCPFQCNYCQPTKEMLFGKKVRRRSIDGIVAEIQDAMDRFAITNFSLDDDTFTFSKRHLRDLCDRIEPLNLSWSCQSRSDIDRETLQAMRDAGCQTIYVGVESGSQRILDLMNKKNSVENNRRFLLDCNAIGIKTWCNMMVGYPGETEEDLEMSLRLVRETQPSRVCVSQVTPFPGTYLWDRHRDDVVARNWKDMARHVTKPKFKSMAKYQGRINYYLYAMTREMDLPLNGTLIEQSRAIGVIRRRCPGLFRWEFLLGFLTRKYSAYCAHLRDGLCLARNGKVDEAIRQLEALKKRFPRQKDIYGNLGWIYFSADRMAKAAENYQSLLKIEENNVDARILLARALQALGKPEQAARECEKAVQTDPARKEARELLESLSASIAAGPRA